jgi:hypothetical protein
VASSTTMSWAMLSTARIAHLLGWVDAGGVGVIEGPFRQIGSW